MSTRARRWITVPRHLKLRVYWNMGASLTMREHGCLNSTPVTEGDMLLANRLAVAELKCAARPRKRGAK